MRWHAPFIVIVGLAAASAALLPASVGSQPADPCAVPAATTTGAIRGMLHDDSQTCSWHGIPFAAPPVDGHRWQAPIPPEPWEGIRDGSQWGARCMQKKHAFERFMNRDPSGQMSEDCLYLNVWSPHERGDGPYPVMVFMHGGGLGMGTANTPMYWGDRLAQGGDVVVVTPNYRLGALGYLALESLAAEDPDGSTGNYGVMDQIAALQWVHDNIAAFGGDPHRVTIFGESGGSWSVCTLLASPPAQGLFHGAILQSGACQKVRSLDDGFEWSGGVAESLGCEADDLDCLRALPAKRIAARQPMPSFSAISYSAHIDGHVLAGDPVAEMEAGRFNRVPLVAGTTRDEAQMLIPGPERRVKKASPLHYQRGIARLYPLDDGAVAQLALLYPLEQYDDSPYLAYSAMVTDEVFACPTREVAEAFARHDQPTYVYRFAYDDHRMASQWGAHHAVDLPFTFDALGRPPFDAFFSDRQVQQAQPLARELSSRWTTFAHTAVPHHGHDTAWPRFDPTAPRLLLIDHQSAAVPLDDDDRCAFWATHRVRASF